MGLAIDLACWDIRSKATNHPVGTLARRLIWQFCNGKKRASAIFHDGRMRQRSDKTVDWLDDKTQVRLSHPLDEVLATITEWRDRLVRHEVRQPFKQAHREVYLLTDAERTTRTYSNRFMAVSQAAEPTSGWRGNQTGLWPDAKVPFEWSRIPHGSTAGLRCRTSRPATDDAKEALPVEKGLIREWLVIGPFAVGDSEKNFDDDPLNGEGLNSGESSDDHRRFVRRGYSSRRYGFDFYQVHR